MRRMAKIATYEAEENSRILRSFEKITDSAQGLNCPLFEIIRSAAEIPQPTTRTPLAGYTLTTAEGVRTKEWVTALSFGSNDIDPEAKFHTPLTKKLGAIRLDSMNWAHYGFTTPVRTILINSHARINEHGALERPTSTVIINQLRYDPDNLTLDDADIFTGSLYLDINQQGEVATIKRTSTSYTGFKEEKRSLVTIEPFLTDLKRAVDDTVLTYRQDELG